MIPINMILVSINSFLIYKTTLLYNFISRCRIVIYRCIINNIKLKLILSPPPKPPKTWYFIRLNKKSVRPCPAHQLPGIAKHLTKNGRRNNILTLLDMYKLDRHNLTIISTFNTYKYRMSVTLFLSFLRNWRFR